MNKKEFVENLKAVTSGTILPDIKYVLEQMPLHQFPQLQIASEWYNSLNQEDKANTDLLIQEIAERSVFGVLCVIDGARTIENTEEKGTFELYYVKNNNKTLINTEEGEYMHDLL